MKFRFVEYSASFTSINTAPSMDQCLPMDGAAVTDAVFTREVYMEFPPFDNIFVIKTMDVREIADLISGLAHKGASE